MSARTFTHVGTRPVRHDGADKVTGRANFGADFSLPGMLHGAVLRSPHAHARIVSIDTSEAEALPGVKAVVTGQDFPKTNKKVWLGGEGALDLGDMGDNLMAHDKALYDGHAVAAVAATSLAVAREALRHIHVVYETLEPAMSLARALAADAPILHDDLKTSGRPATDTDGPTNVAGRMELSRGDVDQALADAEVVVEGEFQTPMVHQGYIEPHACVARHGVDGRTVVWCPTQGPFLVRDACAGILGVDAATIRVIPSEIGGGFGGKIPVYLEPLAIQLSKKSGRAVKMVMGRDEVFRATGPTSGCRVVMQLGAMRDGRIVAAKASMWFEAGAYAGSPSGAAAMCALACYNIPNFFVESFDVVVNKPKVAAYRAPGSPMSTFATESLMDEMAHRLGKDPLELRLQNAVDEGDRAPYGPKYGPIGLKAVLETVRQHPHWTSPLAANRGRGMACGFWFNAGMNSSATVALDTDGSATVVTGNPDIGGTRVAQALMVSEELGIPVERVRPVVADTDTAGYTDLTAGSRTCYATGMAIIQAAQDVKEQLRLRAVKIWNLEPDQVAWENGKIRSLVEGDERPPLSLNEVAATLAKTGGPVVGRAAVNAPTAGPAFAANICDIDVDPETGRSTVVRYTAIQDAGKAVHPSFVEGQMQGGAAQGIGWALNEAYLYDERGCLQNPGFLDYRMPVASDLPMIDTVIVEVANPSHPYGVRGVGEVPIVPPLAAVANAVWGATGLRFTELPMSPPRVLAALEARDAV
ncbi:MAG: xanthine dehydrogenase family protein molybdopterin-binding subunit [Acidobacteria bacterium]|nr:xanthine dehydrogenase family protein molybdopterin-binding subunit [Acidobacteriota bacterium]